MIVAMGKQVEVIDEEAHQNDDSPGADPRSAARLTGRPWSTCQPVDSSVIRRLPASWRKVAPWPTPVTTAGISTTTVPESASTPQSKRIGDRGVDGPRSRTYA